jgi:hypothetical protein
VICNLSLTGLKQSRTDDDGDAVDNINNTDDNDKYMSMSRHQSGGRNPHKSFENVAKFQILRSTLTTFRKTLRADACLH